LCEFCEHRSPPIPLIAVGERWEATAYAKSLAIAQPLLPRRASMSCGAVGRMRLRSMAPKMVLPILLSVRGSQGSQRKLRSLATRFTP
jgi:hypothetical protein